MIPSDIIRPRSIVRLAAANKPALFRALAKKAAEQLALPEAAILDALNRREALGSTGVGGVVQGPHHSLARAVWVDVGRVFVHPSDTTKRRIDCCLQGRFVTAPRSYSRPLVVY